MQKAIRRAALAKDQVTRKKSILKEKYRRRDSWRHHEESTAHRREELDATILARKRQREDWALGPIKPWREQGASSYEFNEKGQIESATSEYGVFDMRRLHPPPLPKDEVIPRNKMVIRKGDRVCVVKGRVRTVGRIGTVDTINEDSGTVKVKGVNMIDVESPKAARGSGEDAIRSVEEPVRYEDLRLVYPMPMEATSEDAERRVRDTVLNRLELRHAQPDEYLPETEEKNAIAYELEEQDDAFERGMGYPRFDERNGAMYRYLMPQNIRIPWPAKQERRPRDQAADTLRTFVEEKTFLPTLKPPMPEGIIDELRNRSSRFRVRHDDEYRTRMEQLDREEEAKKKLRESMKPKGARNIARPPYSKGKPTSGNGSEKRQGVELPPRILDILGSHIAFKKDLQNAGHAPMPPPSSTNGQGHPTSP